MRDPVTDPLLTPQNSALLVIDYQPSQIQAVTSIDHDLLVRNIVSVARLAKAYGLPIVLSTVNVAANGQPPTIPELREVLSASVEIDRTQINSWEDIDFRRAVEATAARSWSCAHFSAPQRALNRCADRTCAQPGLAARVPPTFPRPGGPKSALVVRQTGLRDGRPPRPRLLPPPRWPPHRCSRGSGAERWQGEPATPPSVWPSPEE
jgi:nicotinamidase-related amidase